MTPSGLFPLFVKIALLTFGGGYAMVPIFQNEIVARHALMTAEDFANLVALAQVTPGPIGFNAATYVGMASGGWTGAAVASLGVVAPTFAIALAVAFLLRRSGDAAWMKTVMRGVRPCVIGVIASAVVFFAETSVCTASGFCWQGAAVFACVVFIRWKWKALNPVWSLLASALLGGVLFLI